MTNSEIMDLLVETGVVLDGHFLLTSGLHSPRYLQCARVLQYPEHAERLGDELARRMRALAPGPVDAVIGPALGGVIVAHEVARAIGCRGLFAERVDGRMTLRRGLEVRAGERVMVVEDVVTTGGSLLEVVGLCRDRGAVVAATGSIVDRRPIGTDLGLLPYAGLVPIHVPTYEPGDCPMCQVGTSAVKPGSRMQ